MTDFLALFAWVSLPVIVWFLIQRWVPKWFSAPLYAGAVGVLFYIFILASANYYERKVLSDLVEFDRVHAGAVLTDVEQNERRRLGLKIGHDTGRTFAPVTGAIGGIFYFALIWFGIFIVGFIVRRALKFTNAH